MRQLTICLFTLLIGLPAVGRCQDVELFCPYLAKHGQDGKACCRAGEKCCVESTTHQVNLTADQTKAAACQTKTCACQAKVAACQANSTACESAAAACVAKATACQAEAAACQVAAKACQAKTVACPAAGQVAVSECQGKCSCKKGRAAGAGHSSDDRITHLKKAAKHLHAAGMKSEAKHVLAKAEALHHKLLAHKIAQLKRLQAEVHQLQHATARAQKVLIHVQTSPASLHKSGLRYGCEVQATETVVFGEPLQHTEKAFGQKKRIHTLIIVTSDPAGESESPEVVDTPQPVDTPTAEAPATTRKQ